MSSFFDSKLRMRILIALFKEGEMNIGRLLKKCNSQYKSLMKELKYLEEKQLIEMIEIGRARIVRLNYSSSKILALRNLLEELGEI